MHSISILASIYIYSAAGQMLIIMASQYKYCTPTVIYVREIFSRFTGVPAIFFLSYRYKNYRYGLTVKISCRRPISLNFSSQLKLQTEYRIGFHSKLGPRCFVYYRFYFRIEPYNTCVIKRHFISFVNTVHIIMIQIESIV